MGQLIKMEMFPPYSRKLSYRPVSLQILLNNPSAPVLQSVKNPDRKTCMPLAIILLHSINTVGFLPNNQRPIIPPGLARVLLLGLGRESLIGSFT
jgi:hypothetical protein